MKKFFQDFKKFITRGNVIDMAVGVIIGSAFSAIVTALTNKIIMPLINALLSKGKNGLDSAYTFLKTVYASDGTIDLTKSIYIDWGAFITAILNFFLIAMVLFVIIKVTMSTRNFIDGQTKKWPTRAERKELKANGVNMTDTKAVLKATEELRESKKEPTPEPPKPQQEVLLENILEELKKQNESKNA